MDGSNDGTDGFQLDADAELPWWSRTYLGYHERFVLPYTLELTPEVQLEMQQMPFISAEHAKEAKASSDGSCTASTVWDAGIVLAAHVYHSATRASTQKNVDAASSATSMRCLDLGSGTGIVGLAAAASGAFTTVVLTDLPSVVPLLQQNTALNAAVLGRGDSSSSSSSEGAGGCEVVSRALSWDDERQLAEVLGAHGPFDLITGGDLVFRPQVVAPLLTALSALAGKHTAFLTTVSLIHSPETIRLFVQAAREAGFEVDRIDDTAESAVPEGLVSPEVRILRLRRARKPKPQQQQKQQKPKKKRLRAE